MHTAVCSSVGVRGAACLALIGVFLLAGRGIAAAQVDCSNPDNLCTGDPCVTGEVTVQSPCVADFSPRTLVIGGTLTVPNGGSLQLTAGNIDVSAKILGNHTKPPSPNGADVTLIAGGNILIKRRVDVSGRSSAGDIVLDAGGDIVIRHQLRARGRGGGGGTAPGGTVTVTADGVVSSTRRGKIDVRGRRKNTAAGQASLSAVGAMELKGRVEARGSTGGVIVIASSSGNIVVEEELRAHGDPAAGGSITVTSPGAITMAGRRGRPLTPGVTAGGPITLTAASVDLQRSSNSRAGLNAMPGTAGPLLITTTGQASVRNHNGRGRIGGFVGIDAGSVSITRLRLAGGTGGGTADIDAGAGVGIKALDLDGGINGGTATVNVSSGDIEVEEVDARGDVQGGELRFAAPAGNIVLGLSTGDDFRAGDVNGVIEAIASGDVTARGKFAVGAGGCIGLSAGGTLDTSQATFDVTPVASCP